MKTLQWFEWTMVSMTTVSPVTRKAEARKEAETSALIITDSIVRRRRLNNGKNALPGKKREDRAGG